MRELRLAKGLSQRDLAAAAQMDHTHLCQLERGRIRAPNVARLVLLARALKVGVEELIP